MTQQKYIPIKNNAFVQRANNIKQMRNLMNLSIQELYRKTGINTALLNQVELGIIYCPEPDYQKIKSCFEKFRKGKLAQLEIDRIYFQEVEF